MAMRTSLTTLVVALLVGFSLLIGHSAPARAHAGHNHSPNEVVAPQSPVHAPTPIEPFVTAGDCASMQTTDPLPPRTASILCVHPMRIAASPEPLYPGACCCGSIACHAGLDAPAVDLFHPRRFGQRMRLPRVLGVAKTVKGGVERPPRGPATL